MKKMLLPGGIILGSLLVLGSIGYGLYSYKRTIKNLKSTIATTKIELAATKAESEKKYSEMQDLLAGLETSASSLSQKIVAQEEKSTVVEQKVGAVTTTLGTLEKLSKTDPELLKKYSKVYFLNEHYVPISLSTIDAKYLDRPSSTVLQIHANVWPHLLALLEASEISQSPLEVDSAYRSFGTQATLKASYRVTYGAGTANSFSAEQGYSEHQLGTTVDFTTKAINGGLSGFDKTAQYVWLQNNAYKYGFVISYPRENEYYMFEPWHWRYVGVKLATDLHSQNKFFYDVDQRVIDSYLADIFDL